MNYWWVRIFDYNTQELPSEGSEWHFDDKGTLLDEYYLLGEDMTREQAKAEAIQRSGIERFAKPKGKKSGVYAILMESNQFFYERHSVGIDTMCFNCYKPIKGKVKDFPKIIPHSHDSQCNDDICYYCCSFSCQRQVTDKIRGVEGEYQDREDYSTNGGVFGYIYHIYNRAENKHYIGQTRYMPFFRWQEHAKAGIKGNITDLIFETVCEVRVKSTEYLNSVEAWWIRKYIDDFGRDNVMNITVPPITIQSLIDAYKQVIEGQARLF